MVVYKCMFENGWMVKCYTNKGWNSRNNKSLSAGSCFFTDRQKNMCTYTIGGEENKLHLDVLAIMQIGNVLEKSLFRYPKRYEIT